MANNGQCVTGSNSTFRGEGGQSTGQSGKPVSGILVKNAITAHKLFKQVPIQKQWESQSSTSMVQMYFSQMTAFSCRIHFNEK